MSNPVLPNHRRVGSTSLLPTNLVRFGAFAGVALALLILFATLSPQPPGPPMQGHADKLAHFLGFMALVVFPAAVGALRLRLLIPLAMAYGGVIELVQPYHGRTADWADFWANNAGVAAGAALGFALNRVLRQRYARMT